jgi:peroxidase
MRQFKRTWDGDHGFHFGDFPGHLPHRPHGSHHSHGSHGHHGPPCPPDPKPSKIEYRSFDGSQNNQSDATLNAAGTEFARIGEAHFADGISVPLGGNNPRTISNLVVGAGDPDVANPEGVSAFMYAWGQFIDHDLTLTRTDGVSDISVVVPAGDSVLPAGTIIPITRAVIDPTTGAGTSNPAMALNSNTAWLDASMVYGSNAATAASLRTADGHMLTSQGNNLPIVNGMVVAGDVRAGENPALTALQTLFVREHNYWVDKLHL